MYGRFTNSQLPHCLVFYASHKVKVALRGVLATGSSAFLVSLFVRPKNLRHTEGGCYS